MSQVMRVSECGQMEAWSIILTGVTTNQTKTQTIIKTACKSTERLESGLIKYVVSIVDLYVK